MFCPPGYSSKLDILETEVAVKFIKDFFEDALAKRLNLTRVSAPLFVRAGSGINDNLSGTERPVGFDVIEGGADCEIVHSLAKWKRLALMRYGIRQGAGLYADMNAIRRDEITDNLHSIYVDQWDWEKNIPERDRNEQVLKNIVSDIYCVIKDTESAVLREYGCFEGFLPQDITFVTAQELEDLWPALTPKEREDKIAKEHGAVFLMQIGGTMRSGDIHDGRAPDYDDWSLNGDILVYYPLLDKAVELSSMGIRVDAETLRRQLEISGCTKRAALPFHKMLLSGELPQSVGGGIGQSRLCMIYLNKAHIGEVQSSVWPEETLTFCEENNITLL